MMINANGGVHVATCCKCGASLTYPVWVDVRNKRTGKIVKSKAYGNDCFEAEFGYRYENLPAELRQNDNHFDQEAYEAKKAADKTARVQAEKELADRKAACTEQNAWLIELLMPYARIETYANGYENGLNFFGGIVISLRNGQLAMELPERAKNIIVDALAKEAGRSGSKRYNARYDEMWQKLYPETAE